MLTRFRDLRLMATLRNHDRAPFVHHHLGLGDAFTSSAIVRRLADAAGESGIHVFAKECNAANVRFLYRDEPRIRIVPLPLARDRPVGEHTLVAAYLRAHRVAPGRYIRIGFEHMAAMQRRFGTGISCDECFYAQANLPYGLRFSEFRLQRDPALEEQAYARANPSGEPYAFVDADPARALAIPTLDAATSHGARPGLRRLLNDPAIPLLHMGLILERAEEIHVCESAIRCLVEGTSAFDMSKPKLFLHAHRGGIWGNNTALRWIQIGPAADQVGRPEPFERCPEQQALVAMASAWCGRRWKRNVLRRQLSAGCSHGPGGRRTDG